MGGVGGLSLGCWKPEGLPCLLCCLWGFWGEPHTAPLCLAEMAHARSSLRGRPGGLQPRRHHSHHLRPKNAGGKGGSPSLCSGGCSAPHQHPFTSSSRRVSIMQTLGPWTHALALPTRLPGLPVLQHPACSQAAAPDVVKTRTNLGTGSPSESEGAGVRGWRGARVPATLPSPRANRTKTRVQGPAGLESPVRTYEPWGQLEDAEVGTCLQVAPRGQRDEGKADATSALRPLPCDNLSLWAPHPPPPPSAEL